MAHAELAGDRGGVAGVCRVFCTFAELDVENVNCTVIAIDTNGVA
jgi:hypothetical protein